MSYDKPNWKDNWESTKRHFKRWWNHEGSVITLKRLPPLDMPRTATPPPPEPPDARGRHTDPEWFAWNQRNGLLDKVLQGDNMPLVHVDYGCVQLAASLGSEPDFTDETVWYAEAIHDPDSHPPLVLTKEEYWWKRYKAVLMELVRIRNSDFLIGAPAFGSNMDVMAALRGTQNVLFDLVDRPDWVHEKLEEINQVFFVAFDDYYEQIKLSDGSSAYTFFNIWGPGKTSQVQCDFAAMISPDMFKQFVVPALSRQCAWLDNSLFHLDGPDCICHLPHLLEIEELDAVQWTPGSGQPGCLDPMWYELYKSVLDAGKSVQIMGAEMEEARRIFKLFGTKGIYMSVKVGSEAEANEIMEYAEK